MLNLLRELLSDEKRVNRKLYSSGEYWKKKNQIASRAIMKKGISSFRGAEGAIGTSFADNLTVDIRDDMSRKGRAVGSFMRVPPIRTVHEAQLGLTSRYIELICATQALNFRESKYVGDLLEQFLFENTTDFGCIQTFEKEGKSYSCFYLELANRVNRLQSHIDFNDVRTYFEIGGGFGANVHFMITNFPNIRKVVYLDAVPNIAVGTEYLKSHFGDAVKDYCGLKDWGEIAFADDDELEIFCIPPWSIEKLRVQVDHFHNAHSFVEMPKDVVRNYGKFLKKFSTREISLVSYSNFDPMTTFDVKLLSDLLDIDLEHVGRFKSLGGKAQPHSYLTSV